MGTANTPQSVRGRNKESLSDASLSVCSFMSAEEDVLVEDNNMNELRVVSVDKLKLEETTCLPRKTAVTFLQAQ